MVLLDIPFQPDATACWRISVPGEGLRIFADRPAALRFAMDLAKKQDETMGHVTYISLEGADGRWRLFDANFRTVD
jgi:hypothetical protein